MNKIGKTLWLQKVGSYNLKLVNYNTTKEHKITILYDNVKKQFYKKKNKSVELVQIQDIYFTQKPENVMFQTTNNCTFLENNCLQNAVFEKAVSILKQTKSTFLMDIYFPFLHDFIIDIRLIIFQYYLEPQTFYYTTNDYFYIAVTKNDNPNFDLTSMKCNRCDKIEYNSINKYCKECLDYFKYRYKTLEAIKNELTPYVRNLSNIAHTMIHNSELSEEDKARNNGLNIDLEDGFWWLETI